MRCFSMAGSRRHTRGVRDGVPVRRRQWPKDAHALALQQFRNERHRQIRLAAADRVGGGDAALLGDGLGGDDLRKPDAAKQITQVDPRGAAHRGIAQRNGAGALQRIHEGVSRRNIGRRRDGARSDADRRARNGGAAAGDNGAGRS
jgi:hypothetical protein